MYGYAASVIKTSNLEHDIAQSLENIGWENIVRGDSTVFIKPNFTYPYYKEGITTNPKVLQILLEILKDRCDRVIVGESDGGNRSYSADEGFKGHGMFGICKETGAELVNLSSVPSVYVEERIQNKKVKVQLPELLLNDIDCFISVPVLKVHVMTTITLSIKNLWGCYPDTMRSLHHKHLSQKLALITKTVNPQIALIDGTYALDGHGPMFGTPKRQDLLIAANNPVVADGLGSRIMGVPPSQVDHIMVAEREGLGTTDLTDVAVQGSWEEHQQQFSINRTLIDRLSVLNFKSELLPKMVFDSPLSPYIFKITDRLRTREEWDMSLDLKRYGK